MTHRITAKIEEQKGASGKAAGELTARDVVVTLSHDLELVSEALRAVTAEVSKNPEARVLVVCQSDDYCRYLALMAERAGHSIKRMVMANRMSKNDLLNCINFQHLGRFIRSDRSVTLFDLVVVVGAPFAGCELIDQFLKRQIHQHLVWCVSTRRLGRVLGECSYFSQKAPVVLDETTLRQDSCEGSSYLGQAMDEAA